MADRNPHSGCRRLAGGRPSYAVRMANPAPPRSTLGTRVVVGILALIAVWIVLRIVLGMVYSLIRAALFVALFAVIAWVVLVGPPGRRD
jgi:hypothetical protein